MRSSSASLEDVFEVYCRLGALAFDGDRPRLGLKLATRGLRIVLVRRQLVEIVVGGDVLAVFSVSVVLSGLFLTLSASPVRRRCWAAAPCDERRADTGRGAQRRRQRPA